MLLYVKSHLEKIMKQSFSIFPSKVCMTIHSRLQKYVTLIL